MVLFKDGEKTMIARFQGVARLGEANQLLSNPYAARWLFSFRLPPLVHRPIFHPPPRRQQQREKVWREACLSVYARYVCVL